MPRNNFQELERQEMEQRSVPRKIKSGIDSQVGFFQFVGSLFELYLPKMVDLFVNKMTGDGSNDVKPSAKNFKEYPNK